MAHGHPEASVSKLRGMTVATLVCETLDLVPKRVDEEMERHEALVAAALKARKVAEKVVEKRRILRAHGIEGDPTRLTPTQRLEQQLRSHQARPNDPPFPPDDDGS
jgi:hypothetical protein